MFRRSSGPITFAAQQALNIGKQSRAGALGLLFYERVITLGEEVDLVWSNRWSLGHFLYLFNGWFGFLWLLFDTIPLTRSGVVKSNICAIYLLCDDIATLLTTMAVQIILQIRVWALFDRDRRILLFLVVMTAAEVTVMIALVVVTITSLERIPVISTPTGCAYRELIPTDALLWAPALIVEPILCALVLWKSWHTMTRHLTGMSLYHVLTRDSVMYFVIIFSELLAATIIWSGHPMYINIIMPWSTALPSLLGNRLLLNMRQTVVAPQEHELDIISSPHPSYRSDPIRFSRPKERPPDPEASGSSNKTD